MYLFSVLPQYDSDHVKRHLKIYRVKIMNSRIVEMRKSFPLSETFPKLQKKSDLDKFCKRYGWINQLPRQDLPAATCEFVAKSANSRHF
jgi:hypothetical protein